MVVILIVAVVAGVTLFLKPSPRIRTSLYVLLWALLIEELGLFAHGLKSCGDLDWGLHHALDLTLYYWWLMPWLPGLLVAAAIVGFIFSASVRNRWQLWLAAGVVLAIASPLITMALTVATEKACSPL